MKLRKIHPGMWLAAAVLALGISLFSFHPGPPEEVMCGDKAMTPSDYCAIGFPGGSVSQFSPRVSYASMRDGDRVQNESDWHKYAWEIVGVAGIIFVCALVPQLERVGRL